MSDRRGPDSLYVTKPQLRPVAAWVSHVGKVRQSNQDSLWVDERLGVFAVADGMGGRRGGETASRLALEVVSEDMSAAREHIIKTRFGEKSPEVVREIAAKCVRRACRVVYDHSQDHPEVRGMGCTLTVLVTLGEHALMAHVGDSRLYLVRDGYMHQLSTDFTMAAELMRAGALTKEQAGQSRWASSLTRTVGTQPTVQVETLILPVKAADRFLICSDGITNEMTDDEILEILSEEEAAQAPGKMLQTVLSRTASDNATGVVIEVAGNPVSKKDRSAHCAALDVLADLFLCEGMVVKDLARVLSYSDVSKVQAGHELIGEDQPMEQFIVCVSGELALQRAGQTIQQLHKGEFVGETTVIRGRPTRAALVATEPSTVIELTGVALRQLARRRPELGARLFTRLALRLSRALDHTHMRLEELGDGQTMDDPGTVI